MSEDSFHAKLKSIYDKVCKYVALNLSNVSVIRQQELLKLKEVREKLDSNQKDIDYLQLSSTKIDSAFKAAQQELVEAMEEEESAAELAAYEKADTLRKKLSTHQEREQNLKLQRSFLLKEENGVKEFLSRSEDMANKFRLILEFLQDQGIKAMSDSDTEKNIKLLSAAFSLAELDSRFLARNLHDGSAQKLSGAIMLCELAERYLEAKKIKEAQIELGKVKTQMQEAIFDIRTLLFQIHPQGLEEGLDVALERYAKQACDRYGVGISFQTDGNITGLSMTLRSNLFRVIHQALDNAIQRGAAKKVDISLSAKSDGFSARIADNGKGFDVAKAKTIAQERGSYGLTNMEERTRLFGGKLTIDSSPGNGTVILMSVPIPEDDR